MPNKEAEVTFTDEQKKYIEEHYVAKEEYDKLMAENTELVKGVNVLINENTDLRTQILFPTLTKSRK